MYVVRWSPGALSDLAEFWTDADDDMRRRITDAVNSLDQTLEIEGPAAGESRDGERRILIHPPLGSYSVSIRGRQSPVSFTYGSSTHTTERRETGISVGWYEARSMV